MTKISNPHVIRVVPGDHVTIDCTDHGVILYLRAFDIFPEVFKLLEDIERLRSVTDSFRHD